MTDKLAPGTKAWDARQRVWRHNAFTGHARMMEANLNSIIVSPSTTEGTKYIAREMLKKIPDLLSGLKTRID